MYLYWAVTIQACDEALTHYETADEDKDSRVQERAGDLWVT